MEPTAAVATVPGEGLAEAELLSSPDGRHSELIVRRDGVGLTLYPWLAQRHRFGPGASVPRSINALSLSQTPAALTNDDAVAIAWLETQRQGEGADECFCAVRAAVLRSNESFGPVQEIARPTGPDKAVVGLGLARSGEVDVLWSQRQSLKLATMSLAGHRGRQQTVNPRGAPAAEALGDVLIEEKGQPMVIYPDWTKEGEALNSTRLLYSTRSPFRTASPLGAAPHEYPIAATFAGDHRGDDLVLTTEHGSLLGASRQGGRSFGQVKTITSLKAPAAYPSCQLNSAANTDGEVLVAWACESSATESGGRTSFAQATLLSRAGKVLALSPQRRGGVLAGEPPGVALGNNGRGLVAFQGGSERNAWAGIMAVTLTHRRFTHWQTVVRSGMESETTVSAAITGGRVGLVSWSEERPRERIQVADIQLSR